MDQPLAKINAILKDILKLYQALLTISCQKREALVQVSVDRLENITKQEEAIIFQIGKLETVRERLVAELASQMGLEPAKLTLSKIREIAGAEDARVLDETEAELSQALSELGQLNKLNTQLIQQSLGFINYNLNLMAQTQVGPTYAPQGQAPQGQVSKALVDRKV